MPARQGDLFEDELRSFDLPKRDVDRIGVVDVGSNSVRMVVFEGGRRCPSTVFNEKVLCGLGSELETTGKLSPDGRKRAMAALKRFVALAPGLRVGALVGVATAAVREASDGAAFRDLVEVETNIRLKVASGEDEAHLAGQGVVFGDPTATGLVVDLGGASMEFCPLEHGRAGTGLTTALGPQRFAGAKSRNAVRDEIRAILKPLVERFGHVSRRLYMVGGAWRALGRVQIRRAKHPLGILHEYAIQPNAMRETTNVILDDDAEDGERFPGVPSARVETLPHAALLMQELIAAFEPEELAISGFGLREGMCFEYLAEDVQRQDPLISTCMGQEMTRARAPGFGAELGQWVLEALSIRDRAKRRLVRAAAHLADVSWRAHPDSRSNACMEAVTRVNVSGAGHHGRAFMAGILLSRYKGGRRVLTSEPALALLEADELTEAQQIGAVMRLGCTLAGVVPGILTQVPLRLSMTHLTLYPEGAAAVLMGEEVDKRLAQAARVLEVEQAIALP